MEIDAHALRQNFATAERLVGKGHVIPIVKANAYGHGLELVIEALAKENVPFYGVDSLEEAERIKRFDDDLPVLVLGYIPKDQLARALALEVSFVVSKSATLFEALRHAKTSRPARIHLEIETGLYRQGASRQELDEILALLKEAGERVRLEGVCTHFANAEDVSSDAYVREQTARFEETVKRIQVRGFAPVWRHAACSAALWLHHSTHFDAVRFGISLYGIWSSQEVEREACLRDPSLALMPALTWKTNIAEVKRVVAGEPIGYGLTERVARDSMITVLPIGYADGFDRRLSSCGEVLVRGRKARVIGRICMNMCMLDVTDIPDVALEDEVVIFGEQLGMRIGPNDWEASVPSLITYEALARLRESIPRRLV